MNTGVHYLIHCKHGFTLLELVVVIAVMAVLSTVALRSLTGVASQSRFEATQRTLEQIHEAILGAAYDRQPDGTLISGGFVADVGRPPRTLDELINPPVGIPSFDVGRSATDTEVLVAGGWRGPYLRLPMGATNLCDGWATALVETRNAAGFVETVSSYGADGLPGGTGYDLDLSSSVTPADYTASLAGLVTVDVSNALNGTVTLIVYGPGTNQVALSALPFVANPLNYAFVNSLSKGLRAVRAYASYDTGAGHTNRYSPVIYLNVRPGLNIQNLTIDKP